jgi:uroporphyrinogen-III synthase
VGSLTSLDGFTVGVTADRRGEEQTLMLSRLGVRVVSGPTIRTLPVADDERLREVTLDLIDRPPDYFVANTAIGIRSWFGMSATWGIESALTAALGTVRIAARGPKAAGAVLTAGLDVWWRAPSEQLDAVADRLLEESLVGRRVAIQMHGDGHQQISETLRRAGADVVDVGVYRWTLPEDRQPALRLIQLACEGGIDGLTFTSSPAVRNFFALAADNGCADQLREAINDHVAVACIGPVCADAARKGGVAIPLVPEYWRLGALVRTITEELRHQRRTYFIGAVELTLQGSTVMIDGRPVHLTERERAVLGVLASHLGQTVTRTAILRQVWDDRRADGHALEVVIARLRTKLGPDAIQTAVRRGYRLAASPDRTSARLPAVSAARGPEGEPAQ